METGVCMKCCGPVRGSLFPGTLLLRAPAWFALAALLLNIMMPVLMSGTTGLTRMEICSKGATREIWVDKDGIPHPAPATARDECCKVCVHFCSMAPGGHLGVPLVGFMIMNFTARTFIEPETSMVTPQSRDPPQGWPHS